MNWFINLFPLFDLICSTVSVNHGQQLEAATRKLKDAKMHYRLQGRSMIMFMFVHPWYLETALSQLDSAQFNLLLESSNAIFKPSNNTTLQKKREIPLHLDNVFKKVSLTNTTIFSGQKDKVFKRAKNLKPQQHPLYTHTHTHTHIYIYIYI